MAIIRAPQLAGTRRMLMTHSATTTDILPQEAPGETENRPAHCAECEAREEAVKSARQEVRQAREALESVEANARSAMEAAEEKAFAEGVRKGREEAAAELASTAKTLGDAIKSLQGEYQNWKRDLDETAATLVYAAVAGILGDVLANERDRANVILARIMEQPGAELTVRVSPADAIAIREAVAHRGMEATVTSDDGLLPGSCTVRTELGELEARLDRQMDQLKRALCAAVEGGQ